MKHFVRSIHAAKENLSILLHAAAPNQLFTVQVTVPTVCGDPAAAQTPGRTLCTHEVLCNGDTLIIPRAAGEWNALFCRITVSDMQGCELPGVRYVDDVSPEVSLFHDPIDRRPRWAMDTPIVNFKNFEVLPAYLKKMEYLYKGEPRHIILTEEGLNTRADCPYTEKQSKYAYVLAYLKLRRLHTVDIFQYYPYMDNPWEFGLALGLRKFGSYTETMDQIPGDPKPVWDAILAMDSEAEEAIIAEAREYIGADFFDYTLNPPSIEPETDSPSGGISLPNSGINTSKGRAASARRAAAAKKTEVNFNT